MLLTGSNNQFWNCKSWIAEADEKKRINFCSNCSFVKIRNRSSEIGCWIRWNLMTDIKRNPDVISLGPLKLNAKLELYHVNPKRYLTIISSWVNSVGEFGCQYASLTRSAGLLINLCKPSGGPLFYYVRPIFRILSRIYEFFLYSKISK